MIAEMISIILSLFAFFVALGALFISKRAYGIQSFSRYFDINNFGLENWEILTPLTPVGKCKDKKEAIIRAFLFHRLNRFRLEKDRIERKKHKEFSKQVHGNNLRQFREILKNKGATEDEIETTIRLLKNIRKHEVIYFPYKFWIEFFGNDYFSE